MEHHFRDFRKEDKLARYNDIWRNFLPRISVQFGFLSGIFSWMVRFSEIQQFLDFLELFPGNLCPICPRFENFGILGRMVSARRFYLCVAASWFCWRIIAFAIYAWLILPPKCFHFVIRCEAKFCKVRLKIFKFTCVKCLLETNLGSSAKPSIVPHK